MRTRGVSREVLGIGKRDVEAAWSGGKLRMGVHGAGCGAIAFSSVWYIWCGVGFRIALYLVLGTKPTHPNPSPGACCAIVRY